MITSKQGTGRLQGGRYVVMIVVSSSIISERRLQEVVIIRHLKIE
jgi:hypothetical protein